MNEAQLFHDGSRYHIERPLSWKSEMKKLNISKTV